jgi:hypothetical protein
VHFVLTHAHPRKLPDRSPIPNCSKPSTLNLEVLSRYASEKEDAPCWYGYSINSIKPRARKSPSQGSGYHRVVAFLVEWGGVGSLVDIMCMGVAFLGSVVCNVADMCGLQPSLFVWVMPSLFFWTPFFLCLLLWCRSLLWNV